MSNRLAKRLLLIGWDAADWKLLSPLLDAGHMPALASLVNRGVIGNISTLRPALSPILWTSILTGKRPHKHGIHGFIEPHPDGHGVRPASSTSRKTKALWNILSQSGLKTHAIGFYASHPAEPINGLAVSKPFAEPAPPPTGFGTSAPLSSTSSLPLPNPWPLPPHSVHPPHLANSIADLRVHPNEITDADLLPFIPRLHEIDRTTDPRPATLARMLALNASVHNVATAVLESEPWDFCAVYYDLIDLAGHYFMPFHPPKMPRASDHDALLYQHVITAVYRYHDLMLARLLQLAGDDATVLLVSDHGFHCDHLRPTLNPTGPAAAAWHRQYGALALAGPGIRKDDRVHGATLLDVTPTVLTLFGLPVANDMDGKPLVSAFESHPTIDRIPSWDTAPGPAGQHPPDLRVDPVDSAESIRQLVELGYLQAPSDAERDAATIARQEWQYNLAVSHLDAYNPLAALPLLQSLLAEHPDRTRIATQLAQCYADLNRPTDCRQLIESLLTMTPVTERSQDPDPPPLPPEKDRAASSDGIGSERAPGLTCGAPHAASPPSAILHPPSSPPPLPPQLHLLLGWSLFTENRPADALHHLNLAEQSTPNSPAVHCMIGRVYARQRRWPDAERAFRHALDIDPDSELAHDGLALALLSLDRPQDAAEHALEAVRLAHFFPTAHYRLGVALVRLKDYPRAIKSFETALSMQPGLLHAHRYLAALYTHLNDPHRALPHRQHARQLWTQRQQLQHPDPK